MAEFEQSSTTLRTYFVRDCSGSGDLGTGSDTLRHLSSGTGNDSTPQLDAPAATSATVATAVNTSGQSNQQMALPSLSTLDPYTGLGGDLAATTCIRGPNSGFAPNSGVYRDGAAIDEAQTSALRQTGDGQVAQYPWRTYTDSSCAQRTVSLAHNEAVNSAPVGSLNYFSQAEIAMANDTAAVTPDIGDLWPAIWWDEMLAREGGG